MAHFSSTTWPPAPWLAQGWRSSGFRSYSCTPSDWPSPGRVLFISCKGPLLFTLDGQLVSNCSNIPASCILMYLFSIYLILPDIYFGNRGLVSLIFADRICESLWMLLDLKLSYYPFIVSLTYSRHLIVSWRFFVDI